MRLDDAWDPESSTYNVTFAPNASGDSFTVGKVAGDAQLEAMLRRCVPPEALEDRMKQARAGSVTIPRVRLDQAQRRALRL